MIYLVDYIKSICIIVAYSVRTFSSNPYSRIFAIAFRKAYVFPCYFLGNIKVWFIFKHFKNVNIICIAPKL